MVCGRLEPARSAIFAAVIVRTSCGDLGAGLVSTT
jgi:hypothetical protein